MPIGPAHPLPAATVGAPATQIARPQPPHRPVSAAEDRKLHATAQSFEAMFLNEMFEQMTAGLPVDGAFGGGNDEKIYRSMQNDQLAHAIAKQGGIGLSDAIYKEMLRMRENQNPPAPGSRP